MANRLKMLKVFNNVTQQHLLISRTSYLMDNRYNEFFHNGRHKRNFTNRGEALLRNTCAHALLVFFRFIFNTKYF